MIGQWSSKDGSPIVIVKKTFVRRFFPQMFDSVDIFECFGEKLLEVTL